MTASSHPLVRVVLVDDQPLFRTAIGTLLDAQGDIEVVGHADDGRQALDVVAATLPDVVLLDLEMPVLNGLEAARVLRERHPDVRIVMLTVNDDDEDFHAAIQAGVHGYLLKDLHPAELFDQVRSASSGRSPIAPQLLPRLLDLVRRSEQPTHDAGPAPAPPRHGLSDRELEILQHAARGLSNREIGRQLFITEGTVKNHVHNALHKLGLDNRVQATALLVQEGLTGPQA